MKDMKHYMAKVKKRSYDLIRDVFFNISLIVIILFLLFLIRAYNISRKR